MIIEEKQIPPKRFLYVFGMFVVSVISVFILAYGKKLLLDQALCLLTLFISYWVVFILSLIHQRKIGKFTYKDTTYRNLFLISAFSWGLMIATNYIPDLFGPVLLVGFLFVAVCDSSLSLASCIFMDLLYCFITGTNTYILYCYCILSIFGILFAYYLKENKNQTRIINYLLILMIQFVVPFIFYVFTFGSVDKEHLYQFLLIALLYTVIIYLGFGSLVKFDQREEQIAYETFLDDEYSLIVDIMHFSIGEYFHDRKVSDLSKECAAAIGANELLAACAGLYYRIGVLEGEPIVDNSIAIAQKHCLPREVVQILYEYKGINQHPSGPESAIVQIVDSVLTKVEAMRETMDSSWNQEMLIYQTLNDFSNEGMYDDSNLTMNQFLKIRNILIMKGDLYDSRDDR